MEYLIKWEGYGEEENMWIPSQNIQDKQLIHDFHKARKQAQPKKKKQKIEHDYSKVVGNERIRVTR